MPAASENALTWEVVQLLADCYEPVCVLEKPQATGEVALQAKEALKSLFDLLEAHAPPWYTKEHYDKAQAALRSIERLRHGESNAR